MFGIKTRERSKTLEKESNENKVKELNANIGIEWLYVEFNYYRFGFHLWYKQATDIIDWFQYYM